MFSAKEIFNICRDQSQDLNLDIGMIRDKIFENANYTSEEVFRIVCTNIIAPNHFVNPQWSLLAGRVYTKVYTLGCPKKFSECTFMLKKFLGEDYYRFVESYSQELDNMIDPLRDYVFDLVGITTLRQSYLMPARKGDELIHVETPQYMYLRVAIHHYRPNLKKIKKCYDSLSMQNFTVASPNYYNSGTVCPNTGSCFLLKFKDTTNSITEIKSHIANFSKRGGGIGLDFSSLRSGPISNTGLSVSLINWLHSVEVDMRCFPQGGKRKGSCTAFLAWYHINIEEFLMAKRNDPPLDKRAPELFYAIKLNNIFLQRAKEDKMVTLFSPHSVPLLEHYLYGKDFNDAYLEYEKQAEQGIIYGKKVSARQIISTWFETWCMHGTPFPFFVENANRKNNQSNAGKIYSSNLCMEITETTENGQIASCNLASINLAKCVKNQQLDLESLGEYVESAIEMLNHTIDRSYYFEYVEDGKMHDPIPEMKKSNMHNRPLGLGVQGFADLAALLDIAWTEDGKTVSNKMKKLNEDVFSTMYFYAVKKSVELAKKHGPYPGFKGSPASFGLFQHDLFLIEKLIGAGELLDNDPWEYKYQFLKQNALLKTGKWEKLRSDMVKYGMRNSLLIALMPTANTAHILGNNECFEPFSGCIYSRKLLSGQFQMINKHLYRDLSFIGLWNANVVQHIIKNDSIEDIPLPENFTQHERLNFLKKKYMSIFDIPQNVILRLAVDRAPYVCQSQSLNIHMREANWQELWKVINYGNNNGLKTMYYLRTIPSSTKDITSNTITNLFQINRAKMCDETCESCVL